MTDSETDHRAPVVPIGVGRDAAREAATAEETALLVRVREHGDRDAYRQLFDRYEPRLRAFALGQGCDPGVADSVVQDVMIAMWERARLYDPAKAAARTWLYALLRNRLIDEHRAGGRRRRAYDELAHSAVEETPDADHERDHHAARLSAALSGLPEEQARVIMMVYIEGRSHREIADLLDTPIGTVKSRVRLALQRLRQIMETPQ